MKGRCEICNIPSKRLLCYKHIKTHKIIDGDTIVKRTTKRLSKPERDIIKILYKLKENMMYEVYYPWAKSSKNWVRLPYDIVIPDRALIIEYDGRQHYTYTPFFHKSYQNFLAAKKRDRLKEKLAFEHGLTVIRISFKSKITEEFISNILKRFKRVR